MPGDRTARWAHAVVAAVDDARADIAVRVVVAGQESWWYRAGEPARQLLAMVVEVWAHLGDGGPAVWAAPCGVLVRATGDGAEEPCLLGGCLLCVGSGGS